ncbi:MAG: FAD/NAD(P)-binding protein [Pirellulaceae bacterium]|nr:FAD/NAD(P)-binding protein [Pirellulaceae bacterium]
MSPVVPHSVSPAHNPWLSQVAVIESIANELDAVATYSLRLLDAGQAAAYRFQPGQFNMLYLPGCGESAISHSGSPASDGSQMIHTIRVVGRVTEAIAQLSIGDQLGVRGPFGTPWPMEACRGRDVVLLSGGIGLAPLRPVIYQLIQHRQDYGRVVLLHGARSPDLLLYAPEIPGWQAHDIDVQTTVDRADAQWQGAVGVVPLLLDRLPLSRPQETMVMACGPEVMMHYSALSALKRGVPESMIWLSIERHMQCAVGLCGHCQVGPQLVCRDGPVFRYDAIKTLMNVRDL